jgi:hypothetical protein
MIFYDDLREMGLDALVLLPGSIYTGNVNFG